MASHSPVFKEAFNDFSDTVSNKLYDNELENQESNYDISLKQRQNKVSEEKLKQEQEQEQEHKSPQTKLPSITKNDLPSITETILSSTQNNDTLSDISSSSDSESEILHGDSTKRHDTDNSMCSSFCVNTTSGEVCTGINLGNNDNNVNLSNSVANITDVFETIDPWLQNKNIK